LASQWTLPAEKKRALDAARRKRTAEEDSYDPDAKAAPKRAVDQGKPKGTLKPGDEGIRENIRGSLFKGGEKVGMSREAQQYLADRAGTALEFIPGLGEGIGAAATGDALQNRDWGTAALEAGGLALGTVPVVGDIAGQGLRKFGREALAEGIAKTPAIRAYHGSPHSFDKFSMDKIGTGEGAQAYGHGLYFAESEGVATDYRDKLSRQVTFKGAPLGTHPMDSDVETAKHSIASAVSNGENARGAIINQASEWRQAAEGYARHARDMTHPEETRQAAARQAESFNKIAAEIERFDPADFEKNPGAMYEVSINADPEDFLDWDKPLSEQPQRVKDLMGFKGRPSEAEEQAVFALARERGIPAHELPEYKALEARMDEARRANLMGGDIWGQAEFQLPTPTGFNEKGEALYSGSDALAALKGGKNPQAAQKRFQDAGIPGIKYLDAGSRSAGGGSRNFVVFDDKIIDIVRKYGIAGALSAGLISEEMARQMQQQGDI
jgi:hypothetical protein